MHKLERTTSYMISNEMAINFDVLGSFVEGGIGGNVECSLIITEKEHRSGQMNAKI